MDKGMNGIRKKKRLLSVKRNFDGFWFKLVNSFVLFKRKKVGVLCVGSVLLGAKR